MENKTKERTAGWRASFSGGENLPPGGEISARRADFNLVEQHHVLPKIWATARYFLFYAPGVFLLYSSALFLSDYFVTRDYSTDYFIFSFVFVGFGIFLTMLGIGKLKNLKYLHVVAAILAAAFAAGFALQILEREVFPRSYDPRRDFDYRNLFGFLIPFFSLLVALVGLLVKRRLDREAAELR